MTNVFDFKKIHAIRTDATESISLEGLIVKINHAKWILQKFAHRTNPNNFVRIGIKSGRNEYLWSS